MEPWINIIGIFLSGMFSLVVCLINNKSQIDKVQQSNRESIAVMQADILHLTEEVKKFNPTLEKIYVLEKENALQNEKIKELERALRDCQCKLIGG